MGAKLFYIKERWNPQLEIYFVACGQMTKSEAAKKRGRHIYGSSTMLPFPTKEAYELKLNELVSQGKSVIR